MADAAEPNAAPPAPAAAPPPQIAGNLPNVVIRNRIPAGGANAQNNLINVRERLFHEIYFKVALVYAQICPPAVRRALEYFILFKAIIFFAALVYLHTAFIKNPATCLQHVKDWPRDGVLRVEVIPNLEQQRANIERTRSYQKLVSDLKKNYFYGIGPQTKENYYLWRRYEHILQEAGYEIQSARVMNSNETVMYYVKAGSTLGASSKDPTISATALQLPPVQNSQVPDNTEDGDFIYSILFKRSVFLMILDTYGTADEQYVVEYSLEYGYLRLSALTRKRLNIPVRVVQLDPMKDKCFGDSFSKFMLRKVLGYDDLLMASVRVIAEQEDNKGYLRNVITGEHYRFVSMWWAAWSSYPTAFSVMILFTFSISMLLRFSHHQIFVFIVDLLQMLEFNVSARFPIAPLLTVILALVGMEAIMSEFFNDATTAFYIILIVWVADQYDAICCHTTITKRHWLRFFYLYHFAFYAYHYRFSGQNRNLSLITSWLFIQHSMVFFFHRYELPVIIQQAQIIILTRNQPNAAAAAGAGGANANAVNANAATDGAGRVATGGIGVDIGNAAAAAAAVAVGQQQLRPPIFFFRQQQIRIPLLGIFPLRNRPLNLGSIQRAFLQRGWRTNLPVRIQMGNVHGINVRSMQARLAAAAAVAATLQGARRTTENTETNNATPTTTTAESSTTTTTSNTTTTNALVPNAADEVTLTTARSSETNIESNEKATTLPTPSPTPSAPSESSATTLLSLSSDAHDVKLSPRQQHQNTTTGNNHVEQPETVQNNKIENEIAHEQQQHEQVKNNNDDDRIMKTECYNAVLTTTATTRTATKQTIQGKETIEASTEGVTLNKNEQLENNFYAITEGDLQATDSRIIIESNQAPQQLITTAAAATTKAKTTTSKMTPTTGDEYKLQGKEIVRNELTADSADMLQVINQVNIENSRLSNGCNVVATISTSQPLASTSASTVAANENFDMIDSNERQHHLIQDDDKSCSNSFICSKNNNDGNNLEIITAKAASIASTSIELLTGNVFAETNQRAAILVDDQTKNLSCTQNDFERNLSNVCTTSNNTNHNNNNIQQHQHQHSANFIAHEAAHSSEI